MLDGTSPQSASFDISMRIIPHVDPLMAVTIINFLIKKKIYKEEDLTAARDNLLASCKKDEEALNKAKSAAGVLADLTTEDAITVFRGSKDLNAELIASKGIDEAQVAALIPFAKCLYDNNEYVQCRTILGVFRKISTDKQAVETALWGRVSTAIFTNDPDAADDARLLRDSIDSSVRPQGELNLQRAWFLHWSLFIAFTLPTARSLLLETISLGHNSAAQSDRYLNVVQGYCQHLLRYLITLAVMNSSSQNSKRPVSHSMREIINVISSEDFTYSDAVTDFIRALLIDFDFTKAAASLNDCRALFATDYFLSLKSISKDFFEAARVLFTNTYSRVNSDADVTNLINQFGIIGYDSAPVPVPAASTHKSSSSNFAPASAHAQIRERARTIVCRSNNILDKDSKKL